MPPDPVDLEQYLNRAEIEYLFDAKFAAKSPHPSESQRPSEECADFVFPIRRKSDELNFYARLEDQLRRQDVFHIASYRLVKEEFTKISRPASLALTVEKLLQQRPHLRFVKVEIERLISSYKMIDTRNFLRSNSEESLADLARTRSCLDVFQYLLAHQDETKGLLPRQIPHGQSTKLIGKDLLLLRLFSCWRERPSRWDDFYDYFGLLDKPAEIRFFAPSCSCQGQFLHQFHGVLAKDWSSQYNFVALSGTLIVENFETFYSVVNKTTSSLIVWGGGWRAVQLREVFHLFPQPIYYWGDIDKEGYEIFGYLKNLNPVLQPLLMDHSTIERARAIHQKKEIFLGPFRTVAGLQAEYELVCRNGIQIEQEQLREEWPFAGDLL